MCSLPFRLPQWLGRSTAETSCCWHTTQGLIGWLLSLFSDRQQGLLCWSQLEPLTALSSRYWAGTRPDQQQPCYARSHRCLTGLSLSMCADPVDVSQLISTRVFRTDHGASSLSEHSLDDARPVWLGLWLVGDCEGCAGRGQS